MCRFRRLCRTCAVSALMLSVALVTRTGVATPGSAPPPAPTLSLRNGEALAVIGVTLEEGQLRDTNRKSLQNRRIGFGLTNLLAEALFDTGKFRLLEEKEVRKRELLENLVYTYWIEPGARFSEQMLQRIAMQLGVELLAYGNISHTSFKQSYSLGPFSHYKQKLQTKVNVCLYAASTRTIVCHEGQGEAQQEGTGAFYEFRNERLDFENNAAGRAAKQAVTLAVQELVTRIQFSP